MMSVLPLVVPLAAKAPDPADVKPGWLAFVVFLALAAATFVLWLSFRRQLKKVTFVEQDLQSGGQSGDRPGDVGAGPRSPGGRPADDQPSPTPDR